MRTGAAAALVTLALGLFGVSAQEQGDRVRVPTSHANVHMGPSSGQQVLVLVPEGTTLTVTDAGANGFRCSSRPSSGRPAWSCAGTRTRPPAGCTIRPSSASSR